MPTLSQLWSILVRNRTRLIALLLIASFFAPQPANAQFGFLLGLVNIVTSGMNTLNNVMTSVNNALRNVIGPILQQINSIMTAAQQIMGAIFDFQRNVIYPQQAIDRARALVGQVQGIYATIRGIWNVIVRSATLPNPRQLEAVLLSRDAGRSVRSAEASPQSTRRFPLPPRPIPHSAT